MKRLSQFTSVVFILLLLLSCTDTTNVDEGPKIKGVVLDKDSQPIEDANIRLFYYTETNNPDTRATINFTVPEESFVNIWISHHNKDDLVRTILADTLEAGICSVSWNYRNEEGLFVVFDVYDCHIEFDENTRSGKADLDTKFMGIAFFEIGYIAPGHSFYPLEYIATSDAYGRFEIAYDELPLSYEDQPFEQYDNNGDVVGTIELTNYVYIWAKLLNFETASVDSVYVHDDVPTDVVLRFE